MVLVICGGVSCRKEFDVIVTRSNKYGKSKSGRSIVICTHCVRVGRSSVKEDLKKSVGKKHTHRELKYGDVV